MPELVESSRVGLHWWTAATDRSVMEVKDVLGGLGPPEGPGGFGQPTRRYHESGAAVFCGSDRPGQPIVINAPGEVCEGWASQLLEASDKLGAWATRYDLANDVPPASLARRRLREMDSAFKRGQCETLIRTRHLHQSDDGWTLYLGGKSSPLMMRAYDQRGDLRVEWQHRPHRAIGQDVAGKLLAKGAAEAWRTLARAVTFPMAWYRELLSGSAEILPGEVRADAALDDVMEQLRKQWGTTLWALGQLGMSLEDLQAVPGALRGSQAAKFKSWATSAGRRGYDAEQLRREVDRLCPKSS